MPFVDGAPLLVAGAHRSGSSQRPVAAVTRRARGLKAGVYPLVEGTKVTCTTRTIGCVRESLAFATTCRMASPHPRGGAGW
jgi:hypothetical protein